MKKSKSKKSVKEYTLLVITSITAICVLVSGLMLFDRMSKFANEKDIPCTVINLNKDNISGTNNSTGVTSGIVSPMFSTGEVSRLSLSNSEPTFKKTSKPDGNGGFILEPGFEVSDDKVVWQTKTDVDIFKVTYDETGDMTVDGTDDKVFAPGTGNSYQFVLKNTGEVPIAYTMEVEAFFSPQEIDIPIVAKFHDYEGNFYAGGEGDNWDDVLELNGINKTETLDVGRHRTFTLDWQWPFEDSTEGGDVYDTMLGNMAVDEDLELTIIINTVAQADYVHVPGGETGDDNTIFIWSIVLVASLALIAVFAIIKKKREYDEEEYDYEDK